MRTSLGRFCDFLLAFTEQEELVSFLEVSGVVLYGHCVHARKLVRREIAAKSATHLRCSLLFSNAVEFLV